MQKHQLISQMFVLRFVLKACMLSACIVSSFRDHSLVAQLILLCSFYLENKMLKPPIWMDTFLVQNLTNS